LSCNVKDQVDGTPLWTASFLASNPNAVMKTHLDFLRGMLFHVVNCIGTLCVSVVSFNTCMPKNDTTNQYETRQLFWSVRSAILLETSNEFSYVCAFNIH
jgi:S-methylmethionine-dependent homocysteine/selenocysteine methylase